MIRTDVTFDSQKAHCAAWLYHPDGARPYPCVILAPGFGAIREMRLHAYAERFAQAGLAVLAFDYRHFGASPGEPRHLLDIKQQLADWTAAVSYARKQAIIDPDHIALWGTSLSGGHVLEIAAQDQRIAAVVAQVPFVDGLTNVRALPFGQTLRLITAAMRDKLRQLLRQPPYYVKIVGAPSTLAAITTPDAQEGYHSVTPKDIQWENAVTARVLLHIGFYRPINVAAHVRCPLLICICENDLLTPPQHSIRASQLAPQGELRRYKGGHFEVYTGELFEQAVSDQCDFLTRHLGDSHVKVKS
jgi:dienelactone hydrolase